MTEIQNSKHVLVIEYWYLRFICNLMLGIWNLLRRGQKSRPEIALQTRANN
jgi:hypothetical protein